MFSSRIRSLFVVVGFAVSCTLAACNRLPASGPPARATVMVIALTTPIPKPASTSTSTPTPTAATQAAYPGLVPVGAATPGLVPDIAGRITAIAMKLQATPPPKGPAIAGMPDLYSNLGAAPYANGGAPSMQAAMMPHAMPMTGHVSQEEANKDTERYAAIWDNPFQPVDQEPLSTFSIDVDTASYSNVRRYLNGGELPPLDAVRIEELINYFPYDDPLPEVEGDPLRVNTELTSAPWNREHLLLRVNLTSRPIAFDRRPASNLVFLIDVSGSMGSPDKLPLVRQALKLLVEKLGENDRVAMVVYAGSSGLVLPSTSGLDKVTMLNAIEQLESGGSTHGSEGIQLAYETATASFIQGGVNRVILCTDGDFNVGITDPDELEKLIAQKAKSGVFLTALGFGTGNLKDETLERLADRGNGNHGYIDTAAEARKLFVEEIGGTLVTVAKDVKLQLEFNPARVAGYRLLGYENRLLAAADFNDDTKDAGEVGAGHRVTALYELVPAGMAVPTAVARPTLTATPETESPATPSPTTPADATVTPTPDIDPLRYAARDGGLDQELVDVKLRYKLPEGIASTRKANLVIGTPVPLDQASANLRFASSVAAFGMLLRHSPHAGNATFIDVRNWASAAIGEDQGGYRAEFLGLVDKAAAITKPR